MALPDPSQAVATPFAASPAVTYTYGGWHPLPPGDVFAFAFPKPSYTARPVYWEPYPTKIAFAFGIPVRPVTIVASALPSSTAASAIAAGLPDSSRATAS